MSTQNARDSHFFLAGWNGHIENPNATTHFLQAMKSAPTPTAPLAAEHATRSDADALARTETAARFLLGWKYAKMPTSPDTLLRQSAHAKPQWAWNAACKLLRFIDGSAPAEVSAVATEPLGPMRTAEGAPAHTTAFNLESVDMPVNPYNVAGMPGEHATWAQGAGSVYAAVAGALAAPTAAPAGHVSAAPPDAFSLEELVQLRVAADDFQDGIDTTVDHDLLARGAIAGFLYCERFTVMDSAALDAAIAAQTKEGGMA